MQLASGLLRSQLSVAQIVAQSTNLVALVDLAQLVSYPDLPLDLALEPKDSGSHFRAECLPGGYLRSHRICEGR